MRTAKPGPFHACKKRTDWGNAARPGGTAEMTEPARAEQAFWRRCSNCKSPIALGGKYWICSVSTCQRVRAPIQFCKPDCWAVHNEVENHRDGWAIEKVAPKTVDEPDAPAKSGTSSETK